MSILRVRDAQGNVVDIPALVGPQGPPGPAGGVGADGKPGADGYTPVKYKDYFTEDDKAEMVSAVIAELPVYNGEVVAV